MFKGVKGSEGYCEWPEAYDLNFLPGSAERGFLISLPRHEAERKEEGVRLKSCHQSNIKKMEADSVYTHLCIKSYPLGVEVDL